MPMCNITMCRRWPGLAIARHVVYVPGRLTILTYAYLQWVDILQFSVVNLSYIYKLYTAVKSKVKTYNARLRLALTLTLL